MQQQQQQQSATPQHHQQQHQYLKIQTAQGEQLVRVQTGSTAITGQIQLGGGRSQSLLQVAATAPQQHPAIKVESSAPQQQRPTAQQAALHQRIAQAVTSGGGSAIVVESQGMQNTPPQQHQLTSSSSGHHALAKMVGGGGDNNPPQHIIQSKIVQHQGRTYLVQFRAQKPIEPGKQILIRTNQTGIGGTALVQEVMDEVIRQQYQKQTDQEKINELALQLQQQSQQHLDQAQAVQKQQQQSSAAGGATAAVATTAAMSTNAVTKLTLQQQQLLLPTEPHPQIAAQHQKNQQQQLLHHQQLQHQDAQPQRTVTTSILQQQLEKGMNSSSSKPTKITSTPVQCMLCIEMPWFPNQEHLDTHYSTAHGIMRSTDPLDTGDLDFSNADLEASLSSMTDLKDDAGDFETLLDALPPSPEPHEPVDPLQVRPEVALSPIVPVQRRSSAAATPSSSSGSGQQQGVTRLCELCGFEPRTKNKSRERMDHLAMKHFRDQMISELRKDKPMRCPRCDEFESKDRQQLFRHMISKHKVLDFYLAAAIERMKAEGKQPFYANSSSSNSHHPTSSSDVVSALPPPTLPTAAASARPSANPMSAAAPQQFLLPSLNTMAAKGDAADTSSTTTTPADGSLSSGGVGGGALVDPIPQVCIRILHGLFSC